MNLNELKYHFFLRDVTLEKLEVGFPYTREYASM